MFYFTDHISVDRSLKKSPHDSIIKLKSPSVDCTLSSPYVHQNNNTSSSQQYHSRPTLLKLRTKFTRSNSFSLGSYSNDTDLFSSNHDLNVLRSILVSNDVVMVLCNSLDATIEVCLNIVELFGKFHLTRVMKIYSLWVLYDVSYLVHFKLHTFFSSKAN